MTVWAWIAHHAEALSALATLLIALTSLLALLASLIAVVIALRTARWSHEPWLELQPGQRQVNLVWDIEGKDWIEFKAEPPGALPRAPSEQRGPLWTAVHGPDWTLLNLGNGPALNIEGTWRLDLLTMQTALAQCALILNKRLESNGSAICNAASNMPVASAGYESRSHFGFRTVEQTTPEADAIFLPGEILGSLAFHAVSILDKMEESGEMAQGKIDLELSYRDKFGRNHRRDLQFGYTGSAFRETRDGKTVVDIQIEIEPSATPERRELLERWLGRKISYQLRVIWLRISARYGLWKATRRLAKLAEEMEVAEEIDKE